MSKDDRSIKPEAESEEFIKFKVAMQRIVAVRKVDIFEDLPKMFRERKPPKKATRNVKLKA